MKKLVSILLIAMMVLGLAACAAPAAAPAAPAAAPAPAAEAAAPAEEAAAPAEEAPADSPVMAKIKSSGKLVVGTEAQYAPFEFKDLDAKFVGCDMWMAEKIAESMGVTLEVVDMSFDGIIPAVMSGQVDMGIAAFTKTEERAKEIDFTDVYQRDQQLLIVKTGNEETYSTKEALKGLKVGAQKGTIQSLLIQSALPDCELFELAKYPALAMEVSQGNIAGLVVDGAVGESLVATNPDIAVSKFEFTPEEADFGKAIVVAKGNEDVVAAANVVIKQITDDGSFEQAFEDAKALAATLGIE